MSPFEIFFWFVATCLMAAMLSYLEAKDRWYAVGYREATKRERAIRKASRFRVVSSVEFVRLVEVA